MDQTPYKNLNQITQETLKGDYMCLSTDDVVLSGNEVSGLGIWAMIQECDPSTYDGTCKSKTEIQNFMTPGPT